jgi:hypothetical protein
MTFEEKLKKVVDEYNSLLSSAAENSAPIEVAFIRTEILRMHPNVSREKFEESWIHLQKYRVPLPLPYGKKIFNEHPLASVRYDDCPDDGEVDVNYHYCLTFPKIIEEIVLDFHHGLTPSVLQPENDFWRKRGGQWVSDAVYNESEHGIIYAFLADGKGKFYSKRNGVERAESLIKVRTWSLRIHDYVSMITFPVRALGSGEVTAFFRHMNYNGLDDYVHVREDSSQKKI